MSTPFTEQLTQGLAVMATIPPTNHAAAEDLTASAVDMSVIRRLISYVTVGVLGTSATVQLYYHSSANSNMVGNTNLGNTSGFTTQLLTGNTANRVESLEIRADQLPAGHRYVQPVINVGTAAAFCGLVCLGGASAYSPANQFNTTNVLDQGLVVG